MNPPNVTPQTQSIIDSYKASNPTAVSTGGTSNWYSQLKAGAYRPTPTTTPKQGTSLLSTVGHVAEGLINPVGAIADYAANKTVDNPDVQSAAQSGINQAKGAITDSQQGKNPLETGAQFGAGVANTIFSPLAPVMKPVGAAINAVGDKVSDIPAVQQFANSPAGAVTSRAAEDIGNVDTIAGAVAGAKGAPDAVKPTMDIAESTASPVVKAGVDTLKQGANAVKEKITGTPDKQLASIANDWEKPTTQTSSAYNKATQIFKKDPNISKFLAEQKITPEDNVDTSGKTPRYSTKDTAANLRDTAGQMSNDGLRPALQHADYVTPRTPVKDVTNQAIQQIKNDKTLTEGDKQTAIDHVIKEGQALQAKYPDGMGLTDMHDNKITYAKNSGYSPINDPATNIKATSNRSLASSLQSTVESKAPDSVPVKSFNQYLSQYYRAADYLQSLDTKPMPYSKLGYIAHRGAQVGGALLAHGLGGGVLADVGGYAIGGALEHAVANLTNPLRAAFIRNLEISNPEAAIKIQDYLRQQSSGNTGIPRLNAPTNESPIPLPGAKDTTPVAPYAARGPVGITPKGQFTRTYTSQTELPK